MTLGVEIGHGPGHIMLDGDPASPTERGTSPPLSKFTKNLHPNNPPQTGHSTPPTFWPMSIVAKRSPISATAELLLLPIILRIIADVIPHASKILLKIVPCMMESKAESFLG